MQPSAAPLSRFQSTSKKGLKSINLHQETGSQLNKASFRSCIKSIGVSFWGQKNPRFERTHSSPGNHFRNLPLRNIQVECVIPINLRKGTKSINLDQETGQSQMEQLQGCGMDGLSTYLTSKDSGCHLPDLSIHDKVHSFLSKTYFRDL